MTCEIYPLVVGFIPIGPTWYRPGTMTLGGTAMAKRVLVDRNVEVPMRDGVILRANVYRPDTPEPVPVVLSRLPYNKDLPGWQVMTDAVRLAEAGFAVVNQDTRGRFQSDGAFYPFVNEGRDGYDTVEWAAAQPW